MDQSDNFRHKYFISTTLSALFMIFASVIVLPILLSFFIISVLHYRILKLKYGNRISCPGGLDILYGLDKTRSSSNCNMLATMDGNITFEKFKEHIWKKFQMNDFPIKNRRLRRYQQKYINIAGYNYFVDDLNPDKNYHFVEITKADIYNDPLLRSNPNSIDSFINDDEATDDFQLLTDHIMKRYGNTKMDSSKSPWQIFFYKQENSCTFLLRFSHVLTDGVHFARFLLGEFGENPIVQNLPFYYKQPGTLKRYRKIIWAYLLLPFCLKRFLTNPGDNPLHGPKLTGKKTRITSEAIPVRDIKEIKNELKTSFNTVLFSCTTYALRCHYRLKGNPTTKTFGLLPVSRQDIMKEVKTRNSHGMMTIMLTTETSDPETDCAIQRLKEIEKNMYDAEKHPSYEPVQLAVRMICPILPRWLNKQVLQANGISLGMSNMPGPNKERIQIGNTYSRDMIFWIPDRDPMGMDIGYLGNIDTVRVSLQIDWALMKTNKEAYDFLKNFRREIYRLRMELGLDLTKQQTEIGCDK